MLIGLLGALEIGGRAAEFGRRDRVVLQALAVEPGVAVAPDRLAEALWGDARPATWSKVVQGTIVRLRRTLGRDAVESNGLGYRLAVNADELDSIVFERGVARARSLVAVNEPARALAAFEDALRLWRGVPFDELADWPPGHDEALRLIEIRSMAQEERLESALASGRTHEAVSEASRLVAEAPFRERRWLLYAGALYGASRQAEALEALRTARRVLRDEHGLDPSPLLASFEQSILRQDTSLPRARNDARASDVCPYPGLAAFQSTDSEFFVGREADVVTCVRRLSEHPLLIVVGPSGCGKSSLVRAGVVPALQQRGQLMSVLTPTPDPLSALETARSGAHRGVGLVVDQLEELTAAAQAAPATIRAVLEAIVDWTRHGPVVVTLRADHLPDLALVPGLAALAERGIHLLAPMAGSDLRRAIEEPARRFGLVLEPGLVDLLLRDVVGEPGALPLLSHALQETWEGREGDVLTVEGYLRTGGISGAVAQSADRVYDALDDRGRTALRGLMLRLVTSTPHGAPVSSRLPAPWVRDQPDLETVLAKLVTSRLVIADDATVAIAHESLATAWPRLNSWLDEDVEGRRILGHLQVAAEGWANAGRPPGELYRGARLQAAIEWRDNAGPMLTAEESEFLAASVAEAADVTKRERIALLAQRRQNIRLRRALGAVAAMLMLAVGSGLLAVRARQRAVASTRDAVASARDAVASARDAEAAAHDAAAARLGDGALVEPAADTSLLLARQAVSLADTPQTAADLLAAVDSQRDLESIRELGVVGFIGAQVQVSPDGSRMLALQLDGVHLIDVASGRRLPSGEPVVPGNVPQSLYAAGFADGGATAVVSEESAAATGTCQLRRFAAVSGLAAGPAEPVPGSICGDFFTMDRFRISSGGRCLVSMSGSQLRIWDRRGTAWVGPRVIPVPGLPEGRPLPRSISFSRDGTRAVVLSEISSAAPYYRLAEVIVLVDLAAGRLLNHPTFDPTTQRAAISPDGDTVAVGGTYGSVFLLPVGSTHRRAPLLLRLPGRADVSSLAWSTDGDVLVAGRVDGQTQVVSTATGTLLASRVGHGGSVALVAVLGPGPRVLSMDDTGVRALRDPAGDGRLGPARAVPRPHAVAAGPAGAPIAVGQENGVVQLYDAERVTPSARLSLGPYPIADPTAAPSIHRRVTALAVTPDGNRLVAGDRVGHLRVWSLPAHEVLWARDDVPVAFLAVSADGRYLATAEFTQEGDDTSPDGNPQRSQVRIWDLRDGTVLALHDTGNEKPRAVTFAPDSLHLIVGFFGDSSPVLSVPDARTAAELHRSVSAVAFAPDGRTAVTVDTTGTASVLDTADWSVVRAFPASVKGAYVHLAFSSDGRFLFVSDASTTAIWDARLTRLLVSSFSLPGDGTNDAVFLAVPADRDEMVIATQHELTRIDLSQHRWEAAACEIAGRVLTKDEWARFLPGRSYAPACR